MSFEEKYDEWMMSRTKIKRERMELDFIIAVANGDISKVKSLLGFEIGGPTANSINNGFVEASRRGYLNIVELLYDYLYYSNRGEVLRKAFDSAYQYNQEKVIRFLITKYDLILSFKLRDVNDLIILMDLEVQYGSNFISKHEFIYNNYLVQKKDYIKSIKTVLQKHYFRHLSDDLIKYIA